MIDGLLDSGLVPDTVVRAGIRTIVRARLREQEAGGVDAQSERFTTLLGTLRKAPIAIAVDAANRQHYEMPAEFFVHTLGPHLKYSAAWWPPGVAGLADAELKMLELTAERAQIEDGHTVLDLGCGWGSLALHLAGRFPRSRIVAVSNSTAQRAFITDRARAEGLRNLSVVTADVNQFGPDQRFDRIVSVEMLEHVRNHGAIFRRIADWLMPDGRFFAHVFAHRRFAYLYEPDGDANWMARHFFTGGMMPSDDLFLHLQQDLVVEQHWRLGGEHYQRTAEAWLANFDRNRETLDAVLTRVHGAPHVARWRSRWRTFFMACAEMFGYNGGQEWMISHFRFAKGRA